MAKYPLVKQALRFVGPNQRKKTHPSKLGFVLGSKTAKNAFLGLFWGFVLLIWLFCQIQVKRKAKKNHLVQGGSKIKPGKAKPVQAAH
tara:strand:+ start:54305 stop:54568 length:264 start_codon:yes stop_codon:yes gene_type:complete